MKELRMNAEYLRRCAGYRRADLEAAVLAGATFSTPTTPDPSVVTDGGG